MFFAEMQRARLANEMPNFRSPEDVPDLPQPEIPREKATIDTYLIVLGVAAVAMVLVWTYVVPVLLVVVGVLLAAYAVLWLAWKVNVRAIQPGDDAGRARAERWNPNPVVRRGVHAYRSLRARRRQRTYGE